MEATLALDLNAFTKSLVESGQHRASFVYSAATRSLTASHPSLDGLARAIAHEHDFAEHEALFFEIGRDTSALLTAFLHHTVRGQGAGGVRHWSYATLGDLVRDGLRLSRGMGRKNALAGLYWGGGKGVIARRSDGAHEDAAYRRALYEEYGRFITSLRGCYITAEDVGTTPKDMGAIFGTTRFVTCIPEAMGGSGNPSPATARGVVCAMEAALDHLGAGTLSGKKIAMQGTGNVGASMIVELLERNVESVVATDVNGEQCRALASRFAGANVSVRHVPAGDLSIFDEPCDVFAPNALGATLNPETIPRLKCRIVCGAANNQLLHDRRDDHSLAQRGILYVPDFVANRMGIVNCANEQYGVVPDDPSILRHFGREWDNSVYKITRKILDSAHTLGITTTEAANTLADTLSLEPHPLFPHRGLEIVGALVRARWHEQVRAGSPQ